MKHLKLLLLSVFLGTVGAAQTTIKKQYKLLGFVQINDTLFISKYEVSIRDYSIFLLYLFQKAHDTAKLKACLPNPNTTDGTIWNSSSKKLVPLDDNLFTIDSNGVSFTSFIGNCPVVNIVKSQAAEYCKFKAIDYQIFYDNLNKKKKKAFPTALVFRLPTVKEWTDMASIPLENTTIICKDYFANDTTGELRAMPVSYGSVNLMGIFNMTGNAAELVFDSDDVLGGSFKDNIQHCNSTSSRKFQHGDHATGFRIVAVVK